MFSGLTLTPNLPVVFFETSRCMLSWQFTRASNFGPFSDRDFLVSFFFRLGLTSTQEFWLAILELLQEVLVAWVQLPRNNTASFA